MAKSADSQESHPDWAACEVEPRCPRCGYNLRMLEQARCPECGLTFDWDEVIADTEYAAAATLFEYNWRSRPVSSLVETLGLTFLPWRLWSRIPLGLQPRIGPLFVLVLSTCLIYAALALVRVHAWFWFLQPVGPVSGPYSPWDYWHMADVLLELSLPSSFAILFLLVVRLFWQTVARYHIRQGHIFRIVVLTWVAILMMRSLIEIVCAFVYALMRWWKGWYISYPDYLMAAATVVLVLLSFGIAFSIHLKVRGGWLWALILSVVAAIPTIALILAASGCFYDFAGNPLEHMLHIWGREWWVSVFD